MSANMPLTAESVKEWPKHELEMAYDMTLKFQSDRSSTPELGDQAQAEHLIYRGEMRRRGLLARHDPR
jgi:hypothetical protein